MTPGTRPTVVVLANEAGERANDTEAWVGVRAVEDLLGAVRDAGSRRLLGEAIRAYQAGALRSAINATWVVVAVDLIAKIRELAGDGDAGGHCCI
jgi:hypothetical protein